MTDTPLILENVSLSFGTRLALDELNLAFRRGITTVVIGTSGSGKSLALKTSAGLLFPDEGEAYFEGRKIAAMNETEYQLMQSRTGFHFQDAALWANKSLKENLTLPLMAGKVNLSDREIDERVEAAFGSVNLDVDPESRPASISMGQRKMVSFLRATITHPEILFLDEPSTFMDAGSIRQLVSRIEAYKDEGRTILMATHDRRIGEKLADEVVVLFHGRLVASGPYKEVLASQDPALMAVLRDLT